MDIATLFIIFIIVVLAMILLKRWNSGAEGQGEVLAEGAVLGGNDIGDMQYA